MISPLFCGRNQRFETLRAFAGLALEEDFQLDADGVVSEVYSGMINSAVLEDRIEKMLLES